MNGKGWEKSKRAMLSRKDFFVCVALVMVFAGASSTTGQAPSRRNGQQSRAAGQNSPSLNPRLRQMYPNLPPNQNPAAVSRGKRPYEANCGFCHGTEATGGNGGPDLIRSLVVNHDERGNLIGPIIRGGRVDKGMPKFSLTDAQISDIVAFLHQRNRDARLRFTYSILNIAVGNAEAGKAYFNEHCNHCHSPTADLDGIASKYRGDQLQQRWISGTGQQQPPSEVTVTLGSGRKYSGRLEHLDEFDVSLYDTQGNYHSFPLKKGTHVEVKDPLEAHHQLMNNLTDTDMHNVTTFLESLK